MAQRRFASLMFGIACSLPLSLPQVAFAQVDFEKLNEMLKVFEKAESLYKQGKYAAAGKEYETLAGMHVRYFGPTHKDTGACWNNAGVQYLYSGNYAKAEKMFQNALPIYELRVGANSTETANTVNNLGLVYWHLGQHAKAENYLERALKVRQANLDPEHPDIAQSINNVGLIKWTVGKLEESETLLRRGLEMRRKALGKHPDVAQSLNNLAILQEARGFYDRAEPLLLEALELNEALRNRDHPDIAKNLFNLGKLAYSLGQFDKAIGYYHRSLPVFEDALGEDSPDVASVHNNLALVYHDLGQDQKAIMFHEKALAIRRDKLPKDHPDIASSLMNLGICHHSLGRLKEAEKLFRESLAMNETKFGRKSASVAMTLHNLADLAHTRKNLDEAEKLYLDCLATREATIGKQHVDTALTMNGLGLLYEQLGKFDKAEPLYQKVLEIREARLGADATDTATARQNLAVILAFQNKAQAAAREMDVSLRSHRRVADRNATVLTESEQLAFLERKVRPSWQRGLSLAIQHQKDESIRELSASWLINGKALIQEGLGESLVANRRAGTHEHRELLQDATEVRRKLAMLSFRGPPRGQEKNFAKMLDDLSREEAEFTMKLRQSQGLQPRPWISTAELRKAIPQDAVLIEFARFYVMDFGPKNAKGDWSPARYAAWVIPPEGKGSIEIVDLGDAVQIDKAVHAVRVRMAEAIGSAKKPGVIKTVGEPESEKLIRKDLAALGKLVFDPLIPKIGKTTRLVLSPDFALWLAPWAALPVEGNRYAVEKYQMEFVVSGRDLVPRGAPKPATGPVIFADPDYDQRPDAPNSDIEGDPKGGLGSNVFNLGKVARLPWTTAEADAIAPHLAKLAVKSPVVLRDEKAQESAFKKLHQPQVLVLSTHGFFLPGSPQKKDDDAAKSSSRRRGLIPPQEHPWLRSGLLLAGCNFRGARDARDDDGILTALEILGTDLRGTELVVLSACETGLGDVQVAEGVAGLRQAFQLAGAQNVLASLWQVSDRDTALLMASFFDNLAKGQKKSEALRNAQISLISKRRENFAAAHPFFWGAFTLTSVATRPGVVDPDAADPFGPSGFRDYSSGRAAGIKAKKPLAVFLGSGATGYHQVSKDGRLSKDIMTILAKNYVCVYIDISTESGGKLAQAFEIKGGAGVVLSDRNGETQTFWNDGAMSNADLLNRLRRHQSD